ncbi:MAG: hypothetical protein V3571_09300 [Pseudodesulfovibrio sp.]
MSRFKSAVIVFVVLAGAAITAVSLDFTDTYVAGRFAKALEAGRFESGTPFSLDAFLEYYDWEGVCVCASDESCPDLRSRLGLPYSIKAGEDAWSLVFVKSYYVVAEVPVSRALMDITPTLAGRCFDRWEAIAEISETDAGKRFSFVAH